MFKCALRGSEMLNLVVFLVGVGSTLLVGGGMVITWFEFRRMAAAEASQPAQPPRTPPV